MNQWIFEIYKEVGGCLHKMQFNISLRPALWRRMLCCYNFILKEARPLLKAGSDSQLGTKETAYSKWYNSVLCDLLPYRWLGNQWDLHSPFNCRHGVCSLLSCLLCALSYPQVNNGINSKIQALNHKSCRLIKRNLRLPPGPRGLPFIGNAHQVQDFICIKHWYSFVPALNARFWIKIWRYHVIYKLSKALVNVL